MNTHRWPDLTAALDALAPAGLVVRTLRAADVPNLVACLRGWYPALAVAAVGYMLDPEFYAANVALDGEAPSFEDRPYVMVVVESDGSRVALMVDELLGQQQVVIKNLESNYRKVDDVSGATIMGDGRVALILDVGSLIRRSRH